MSYRQLNCTFNLPGPAFLAASFRDWNNFFFSALSIGPLDMLEQKAAKILFRKILKRMAKPTNPTVSHVKQAVMLQSILDWSLWVQRLK